MIIYLTGGAINDRKSRAGRIISEIPYAFSTYDGTVELGKRRAMKKLMKLRKNPKSIVKSHFLDSGAFTLWRGRAMAWANERGHSDDQKFFRSAEFRKFIDGYIDCVKKYKDGIDLYANMDAVGNPDMTWKNQLYLEKRGLRPVPVVHYRTDLKWLKRYLKLGYEVIGLGGLVGSTKKRNCRVWLDRAFDMICDTPDRTPMTKIHGFGVTVPELMFRYPWWSVDSTTWVIGGSMGNIFYPRKTKGKWDYRKSPATMGISEESPKNQKKNQHYDSVGPSVQAEFREWIEYIDVPLGERGTEDDTPGLFTSRQDRITANIRYFNHLADSFPPYPYPAPFKLKTHGKGFGLV